jgi:hypothetical protein
LTDRKADLIYVNVNNIHIKQMRAKMDVVQRLDEAGKAGWITVMILGFVLFWPIGLGILCYMICSGRMGQWKSADFAFAGAGAGASSRSEGRSHRKRHRGRYGRGCGPRKSKSSGNSAFDTYREEILRRLEDEQEEFESYLERLRQAKDKEEFESFVAARKEQGAALPEVGTTAPEAESDPKNDSPQP